MIIWSKRDLYLQDFSSLEIVSSFKS